MPPKTYQLFKIGPFAPKIQRKIPKSSKKAKIVPTIKESEPIHDELKSDSHISFNQPHEPALVAIDNDITPLNLIEVHIENAPTECLKQPKIPNQMNKDHDQPLLTRPMCDFDTLNC